MTDPNWIVDLTTRFPAMDRDALNASAGDLARLTDHLACAHDLTPSEAAEVIAEWQDGLTFPLATGVKAAA